jgi:diamine N-acetyltransferase
MSHFTIRRATASDAAPLAELAARTFAETFAKENTAEDLDAHLKSAYGVPQQATEIKDPEVVTLLAFKAEVLVGFAQVRRKKAPCCLVVERPIELQRLYLAGSAHGTGLAAELMKQAREAALELGGTHLWLGVWERNLRAIAFYRKMGLVEVGSHIFVVGADPQRDLVLAAPLAASAIDGA